MAKGRRSHIARPETHFLTLDALYDETRLLYDRLSEEARLRAEAKLPKRKPHKIGR
jgi:hypothetical protein